MRRNNTLEAASMTRVASTLPVVVQRITNIGRDHASILFTVGSGGARKLEEAAVGEALSKIYKNKVRLVSDTLGHVAEGPRDVYRAFVALNRETLPYETASTAGWTNTAANVFADANDNLWEVSGEGSDRLLSRVSDDDLMAVLAERRAHSISTALSVIDSEPTITRHSTVMAFDAASEEMVFGIAVSPTKMFVPGKDKLLPIESASAVAIVPVDIDSPNFKGAPVETASSMATILEYYKKLYGHNAEFYGRLKALIESIVKI